jgi:ketosteroid isomerase-like protein
MKKTRRAAVLLAASLATYAHASPEEASIRAIRAASNHAIQAGDIAALAASLADDFVVIVGNGVLLTRDQYIAAFEHDFKTPGSVRYERIVDSVDLSSSVPLAAEHGHWIGRLPDGQVLFTGTYMAMWRHTGSTWQLRSELFISLTCTDPAACDSYRKRYSLAAPQK